MCGTLEDRAEILLLALELPGPPAGRVLSPGRESRRKAGGAGRAPTAVPADGPASAASPFSALLHL